MSERAVDKNADIEVEDDLDDLDDFLDELQDDILSKPPGSSVIQSNKDKEEEEEEEKFEQDAGKEARSDIADDLGVSGSGLDKQFEDEFAKIMGQLSSTNPELSKEFESFVNDINRENNENLQDCNNNSERPSNFQDIMAEAMNRLKKSGESVDKQLKDEQSSSNDFITQLLSQLGDLNLDADQNEIDGAAALEGGQGDDQLMNNLLNDLISQLISKKILYEPLKELSLKYPIYLKEKKINNDQENKYTKQYEIVMKIVNKFDEKDYEDLKDFPFINKHLEELQELGMPPKELVGENDGLNEIFGGNFNINNNDTNNSFEEGIGKDDEIPEDVQKQLEENCKQV